MSSFKSHLQKAEGYLELNLLDEALNALEDVEGGDRLHLETWRMRCRIYRAAGQWEAAQVVMKHLVSLAPDFTEHWLWTAEATEKMQNRLAARKILNLGLRYHAEHPQIHYQLAIYTCGRDDIEAAKEHQKEAF